MKKLFQLLLSISLITTIISFSEYSLKASGSSIYDATTINVNGHYEDEFTYDKNNCVYKFTIPNSGIVTINTRSIEDYMSNNKMSIRSENEVLYSERFGLYEGDVCIGELTAYLSAGTYYINFYDNFTVPRGSSKEFEFDLKFINSNETCNEKNKSNNTITNASSIKFDSIINGFFAIDDDVDYYKVYLNQDAIFNLYLNECDNYIDVIIYNSNGRKVYIDDHIKSLDIYLLLEAGPYYISFNTNYYDDVGLYSFKVKRYAPFDDVETNMWYFNTIQEVYFNELMSGVGDAKFAPSKNMSRGMVANVLFRMEGSPNIVYRAYFSDVKKGLWYSNAITWASQNKVVSGYANGKFGPDDPITREEMAAMCYNYAKFKAKKNLSSNISLTKYKDYKDVSSYMNTPMKWAVANKIISGTKTGYLQPTAYATRAECAKMLLQLFKITSK